MRGSEQAAKSEVICMRCNQRNPEGSLICFHCQETLSSPLEVPAPGIALENSTEPRYKGVKGWLLFHCIGLTFLGPLISIAGMIQSYREASPHFDQIPGLKTLALVESSTISGLLIFSMYAGTGLWRIRPQAVRTAKRFHVCAMAYCVISVFLPFSAGLPAEIAEAIMPQTITRMLQGMIASGIWLTYLSRSKRVKATYGDAA